MRKIYNNALLCILAMVLIGATGLILSPLAVIIKFEQSIVPSSGSATPEITVVKAVDFLNGLLPRASHKEFASCLQKIVTHAVVVNACTIVAGELKLVVEWQQYALDNVLHFNIPLLTYRQPSSENSSAG
jgi:hypothetical protein